MMFQIQIKVFCRNTYILNIEKRFWFLKKKSGALGFAIALCVISFFGPFYNYIIGI